MMQGCSVPGSISTSASHMCSVPLQLLAHRISVRAPVALVGEWALSPCRIHVLKTSPVMANRSDVGRSYGCWTVYVSVYSVSPPPAPLDRPADGLADLVGEGVAERVGPGVDVGVGTAEPVG